MASSLFPSRNSKPNNPTAEDGGLLRRFQDFAKGITPQEAEKRVDELLRTGQMTKDQFNSLVAKARQFMNMFGLK